MKRRNTIVGYSRVFTYEEIWLLLSGSPLSEIILCGKPYSENIFFSAEIVQLADAGDTISTMGQCEYWSICY